MLHTHTECALVFVEMGNESSIEEYKGLCITAVCENWKLEKNFNIGVQEMCPSCSYASTSEDNMSYYKLHSLHTGF